MDINIKFENDEFNELYREYMRKKEQYNAEELKNHFKAECDRLHLTAQGYLTNIRQTLSELERLTVKKTYSSGDYLVPRGYYCPSPIFDIVVGNCKRGKLLKRLTSGSKPTFAYCFDKYGQLIIVNDLSLNTTELLFYKENTVTGIELSSDLQGFISISECKYDDKGNILKYNRLNNQTDEFKTEIYTYCPDGLYQAEEYLFFSNSVDYAKYTFQHDKDGYLKEYVVQPAMFEDTLYKVTIKRKI